jgi:hypothetical protein
MPVIYIHNNSNILVGQRAFGRSHQVTFDSNDNDQQAEEGIAANLSE